MTAPKRQLRPRRRASADNLPPDLAAWFAGERESAPEPAVLNASPARLRVLRSMPPHALSSMERRMLGLPVEPLDSAPLSALIYPDHVLLPERWLAWRAAHPDARPPAGYEWLDDPAAPEHPPAWLLVQAQKCARRGKRK